MLDEEQVEKQIQQGEISPGQVGNIKSTEDLFLVIRILAKAEYAISDENVRVLISALANLFKKHLLSAGYSQKKVNALKTKFRDAGRRSAPWKPTSSRVPGRPQDGADGNRQNRWLFEPSHKFYATEVDATLVEIKYFLQTLSMSGAPPLADNSIENSFVWLLGYPVKQGNYVDPIQLIPINFQDFLNNPKLVQSGHLIPLDKGGKHTPNNTSLMLARSNQLQGNQTLDEMLEMMNKIIRRHHQS